jgi:hypothetical protein
MKKFRSTLLFLGFFFKKSFRQKCRRKRQKKQCEEKKQRGPGNAKKRSEVAWAGSAGVG